MPPAMASGRPQAASRTRLGTRIRERRIALGLKQAELARRAGMSPSYLNLIEHNRRGIAGARLLALAAALGVELGELTAGADAALIGALREAAAGRPGAGSATDPGPELDRVEEFVARFPGWARLVAALHAALGAERQTVEALSDRLTHDPFLAENLHEILSSVTAIHATAGILTDPAARLETLQHQRFVGNIRDEAGRLADLSRAMLSHFDSAAGGAGEVRADMRADMRADDGAETDGEGGAPPGTAPATIPATTSATTPAATPRAEVDECLARHGNHLPELEALAGGDAGTDPAWVVGPLVQRLGAPLSAPARTLLRARLMRLAADIRALPLAPLVAAWQEAGSARGVAQRLGQPLHRVFHRLAHLPPGTGLPEFGLIECDGAGAVLLRRTLPGFPLPRFGAGCPLWPLYQAMQRPHLPLAARLDIGADRPFRAEAEARWRPAGPDRPRASEPPSDPFADSPPVLRAAMLLRADPGGAGRPLAVGPSCRICERSACSARREPSIHPVRGGGAGG